MTWGPHYWPWFLIMASIAFLGPEIVALVTHSGNSLSQYIWQILHVPTRGQPWPHTAAWFLSQGAFITGAVWLVFHFWYHKFV